MHEEINPQKDSLTISIEHYKELQSKAALVDLIKNNRIESLFGVSTNNLNKKDEQLDLLKEFDRFAIVCGQSPNDMTEYYRTTKWMLKKWGNFDLEDTSLKLHEHNYSARTYNHRRSCLHKFYDWLVKKGKIVENPLSEVKNRRKDKSPESRTPFLDIEAAAILDAFRTDRFCKKCSRYSHNQYFPFVAFLFHTGTRNGEAIGLRVKNISFDSGVVTIENSFSRTVKGTHMGARVLKSTKNANVRCIPMDHYLVQLLRPLCIGKNGGDFVFTNDNGNPIDDKMFQRRVWKIVLKELGLPKRDLYACRHTFATRSVRQGLKPYEVAYLMGDSVQTILKTYFHNNLRPEKLPFPIASIKETEKLQIA